MAFSIVQAWKHLSRQKSLSVILMLSFSFGFIMPHIGITYLDALLYKAQTLPLRQECTIADLTIPTGTVQEQSVSDSAIRGFLSRQFADGYTCLTDGDARNFRTGEIVHFLMIDPSFSEYYKFHLQEGRFFTESDFNSQARVCVVEESGGRGRLGNMLMISDEPYQIIGTFQAVHLGGAILIPRTERFNGRITGFSVLSRDTSLLRQDFPWQELSPFQVQSARTSAAYEQSAMAFMAPILLGVLLIGALTLLYTLFDTYNLLRCKASADLYECAVRMTVGAQRRDVLRQSFWEVFLLMCAVDVLLFCMEPLWTHLTNRWIEHRFSAVSAFAMLAVSFFSAFVLSRRVMRKPLTKPIISLLKGVEA